jgi:hypothetical protein
VRLSPDMRIAVRVVPAVRAKIRQACGISS